MMTANEVENWRNFVKDFKYKPNFHMEFVYEIDYHTCKIQMAMRVPDSRWVPGERDAMGRERPWRMITINQTFRVFIWEGEEYAKDFVRSCIASMEDHEIDEWFRYRGELVFDPHKEKA